MNTSRKELSQQSTITEETKTKQKGSIYLVASLVLLGGYVRFRFDNRSIFLEQGMRCLKNALDVSIDSSNGKIQCFYQKEIDKKCRFDPQLFPRQNNNTLFDSLEVAEVAVDEPPNRTLNGYCEDYEVIFKINSNNNEIESIYARKLLEEKLEKLTWSEIEEISLDDIYIDNIKNNKDADKNIKSFSLMLLSALFPTFIYYDNTLFVRKRVSEAQITEVTKINEDLIDIIHSYLYPRNEFNQKFKLQLTEITECVQVAKDKYAEHKKGYSNISQKTEKGSSKQIELEKIQKALVEATKEAKKMKDPDINDIYKKLEGSVESVLSWDALRRKRTFFFNKGPDDFSDAIVALKKQLQELKNASKKTVSSTSSNLEIKKKK